MKYLTFALLLFLSLHAFGQERPTSHYEKGKLLVGPYTTVASFQNLSTKFGLGVSAEYLLGRNFGFGGVIGGGPDYMEFSGSILGLMGLGSLKTTSSSGAIFVLLIPLAIENPFVHVRVDSSHDLDISISLMKFRYNYDIGNYYGYEHIFASGSVSLGYTFYSQKNWQLSLFSEGAVLYTLGSPTGLQFGFTLRHLSYNTTHWF